METTEIRTTPGGMIAVRGNREVHLLGTSVAAMAKSREMLATQSFNSLYRAGARTPFACVRVIDNKAAPISLSRESDYVYALEFDSVESVELEVARLAPHRAMSRSDYGTDRAYVAALLDLPESAVLIG